MEARKITLEYYNAKMAQFGQDVRTLWNSVDSQHVRFRVLSEIADLNHRSILDVGCGFGDLHSFLQGQAIDLERYVGIDMHPRMVAEARARLPNLTFEVRDILNDEVSGKYDYVLASGIFSLEMPNWQAAVENTLTRMYALCAKGVGANFLSSLTPGEKLPHAHYADPMSILDFVLRRVSTRAVLRHDYRPNDFTVYIYRPVV